MTKDFFPKIYLFQALSIIIEYYILRIILKDKKRLRSFSMLEVCGPYHLLPIVYVLCSIQWYQTLVSNGLMEKRDGSKCIFVLLIRILLQFLGFRNIRTRKIYNPIDNGTQRVFVFCFTKRFRFQFQVIYRFYFKL